MKLGLDPSSLSHDDLVAIAEERAGASNLARAVLGDLRAGKPISEFDRIALAAMADCKGLARITAGKKLEWD
jgi:hypothetical protein